MKASNIDVLSYREFFFLCITGPGFYIIAELATRYFPLLAWLDSPAGIAFALQGLLVAKLVFGRHPEVEAEIGALEAFKARAFVVIGTTVGSMLIFGVPLYILALAFHII